MALVTTKDMFAKALTSDYAIGAFNVNNMEIIQGIVEAAKLEQSPLILQVSAGARKYAKPAYLLKPSSIPDWISRCIWITAKILTSARSVWMTALPPS